MKTRISILLACLLAPAWSAGAQAAEQLATVPVQYREVPQTYSAEGVVQAVRQSTVSAQISGRVKQVLFDVGDTVKKGQVLVRIDEREAAQEVAGSQAQVMQAQAAMQNAKENYERAQRLYAQKFISKAGLDKAQAEYKIALAQAAASEAGAGRSALVKGYTSVIAPYGGVVAARQVEVGELVTPGKPLMTGFDPSQMRVVVNIPQYKLADLGKKPEATVEMPALKRWVKAASVTIQPIADARTHTTEVRVNLPANEAGVYPGMFVRAHFTVGEARKLLIPDSAVVRRSEVVGVYVIDAKGAISLRQVRLGENVNQNEVEVLAGLKPGEQVAKDAVEAGMALAKQDQ